MSRILGIDYGKVRIGLAISDGLGLTAQPLGVVQNSNTCMQEIIDIIKTHSIQSLVVGLPKNQFGDDSKQASYVRLFVNKLVSIYPISVEFVDERLSTVAAERYLIQADVSRKKRRQVIDTQAAMFILQGVLDRE